MSGNKILRGAAVLGIAGLMVKLLGAFSGYRFRR